MTDFQTEREKIKRLPRNQRAGYIWDYYKLPIIAVIAVVCIAVYMISNFITNSRPTQLYVAFVNTTTDLGKGSSFYDGYTDSAGVDTSEENVIFDTQNYFTIDGEHASSRHYYDKLVVLIDASTVDAVVMDTDTLKSFGSRGRLMNLSDERVRQLAEKYSDLVITTSYTDEDGNTQEIPIGFDLSKTRLVSRDGAYQNCAVGISANAQHIGAIEQFMSYVTEEEKA